MTSVGEFVAKDPAGSWVAAGTDCAAPAGAAAADSFLELQPAQTNRTNAAFGSHEQILFIGR